jgi:hypothetical protein
MQPGDLRGPINRVFATAAGKIAGLHRTWDPARGSPVFTVDGVYSSRGWTEWTQGFQYGSALLHFAATGDARLYALGRDGTLQHMGAHLTHTGVHDHGFNNVSTYGTLLHLARAGMVPADERWIPACEMALKVSGAVQATRWTSLPDGGGYIYSFNGPHSLFADTIRSLRVLALAHQLGHVLMGERDRRISLLDRLLIHAQTTARFTVYYGEGRDAYDVRGRVAHESIFNTNDGSYRCPGTQQGYSPFSTWTRGLAWVLCGFAEQVEFLDTLPEGEFTPWGGKAAVLERMLRPARATAEFYLENTPTDGVPYWDTGAPGLVHLGDYLGHAADPFNEHEPVDSSAAAIAAQGLVRLGRFLTRSGQAADGRRYLAAGLTIARTLFSEPYLDTSDRHQGLLLHAVYHRPNGWDRIPPGRKVPCGEACLWGDYHLLELALTLHLMADGDREYSFFGFRTHTS